MWILQWVVSVTGIHGAFTTKILGKSQLHLWDSLYKLGNSKNIHQNNPLGHQNIPQSQRNWKLITKERKKERKKKKTRFSLYSIKALLVVLPWANCFLSIAVVSNLQLAQGGARYDVQCVCWYVQLIGRLFYSCKLPWVKIKLHKLKLSLFIHIAAKVIF